VFRKLIVCQVVYIFRVGCAVQLGSWLEALCLHGCSPPSDGESSQTNLEGSLSYSSVRSIREVAFELLFLCAQTTYRPPLLFYCERRLLFHVIFRHTASFFACLSDLSMSNCRQNSPCTCVCTSNAIKRGLGQLMFGFATSFELAIASRLIIGAFNGACAFVFVLPRWS
jgi:hypothetical protein